MTHHDPTAYVANLAHFKDELPQVENSPYSIGVKILCLIEFNMRFEREIAFERNLKEHPYVLLNDLIEVTRSHFSSLMSCSFLEDQEPFSKTGFSQTLEEKHHQLWQEIWPRHSKEEYDKFVELKKERFEFNELQSIVKGADCVEFGCGNGAILCSLLQLGAKSITGIDWGENSVAYARKEVQRFSKGEPIHIDVANVLSSGLDSNRYDFGVSNGVFHHLSKNHIIPALKEVNRVLRPGGLFWFYTDGNALSSELWDMTVEVMEGVSPTQIEQVLKLLNISREKTVHLMDAMKATYVHASLEEVKTWLEQSGFEFIRRMKGGGEFDQDSDSQTAPYQREKFRDGDIRVLARKI